MRACSVIPVYSCTYCLAFISTFFLQDQLRLTFYQELHTRLPGLLACQLELTII